MKKYIFSVIALAASLVGCTGDYTDWASPISNAQPETVTFGNGSVTSVGEIDFANIPDTQTLTQVCKIVAPTASDASYNTAYYTIELGGKTYDLTANGEMSTSDLETMVESIYGKRPEAREFTTQVSMWISNGTTVIKVANSDPFKVICKPEAPEIDTKYYITGGINGWDNTNTDYPVTNGGGDVYDDPVFTCTLTAAQVGNGFEFKLTPISGIGGDWSKCITAGEEEGKLTDQNKGGNLKITPVADAVAYQLSFNLLDQTYTITPVSFKPYIYFIGATDGWTASDQKLYSANCDGVYTGYCYVADPNGWGLAFKFQRAAGSWDDQINAGSFSTMEGVTGSDNIEVASEGVYYFEINLPAKSIKAVKINNMNLVGNFNGWNEKDDAQQMTWNASEYCYEMKNAGVDGNGWKFTANNGWDINLGGTTTKLVANGDNLSAIGNTVKLYPTRKTNDNIYCTVE